MQLIGHALAPYKPLFEVESIEAISSTPPNSMLLIPFKKELILHCQENDLLFALHVKSIKDSIIGNAAGASCLLVPYKMAKEIQALADHYLFDAKIALRLKDENAIEEAVTLGVDIAILPDGICTK